MLQRLASVIDIALDDVGDDEWETRTGTDAETAQAVAVRLREDIVQATAASWHQLDMTADELAAARSALVELAYGTTPSTPADISRLEIMTSLQSSIANSAVETPMRSGDRASCWYPDGADTAPHDRGQPADPHAAPTALTRDPGRRRGGWRCSWRAFSRASGWWAGSAGDGGGSATWGGVPRAVQAFGAWPGSLPVSCRNRPP